MCMGYGYVCLTVSGICNGEDVTIVYVLPQSTKNTGLYIAAHAYILVCMRVHTLTCIYTCTRTHVCTCTCTHTPWGVPAQLQGEGPGLRAAGQVAGRAVDRSRRSQSAGSTPPTGPVSGPGRLLPPPSGAEAEAADLLQL